MRYTTPVLLLALLSTGAAVAAAPPEVGISPWGPKDEIGRLNLITPASRSAILSRVSGQKAMISGSIFISACQAGKRPAIRRIKCG